MTGADKPQQAPAHTTLADGDIATTAAWDRRTVLRVAAGAAAALATGAAAEPAAAQGISDRDSGPGSDPPGRGRRSAYTGRTDQDPGDPVNGGRGGGTPRRQTGVTDRDAGAGADPPGGGRGGAGARATGVTDRDAGAGADPPGGGRGQAGGQAGGRNDQDYFERPWNSDRNPSDNDTGRGSDPRGEGRGTAAWARRHQRQRGGASTDGDVGPFRDAVARQGGATNLPPADLADSDNPMLPNPLTGRRGNDWTAFQDTGRRINR